MKNNGGRKFIKENHYGYGGVVRERITGKALVKDPYVENYECYDEPDDWWVREQGWTNNHRKNAWM